MNSEIVLITFILLIIILTIVYYGYLEKLKIRTMRKSEKFNIMDINEIIYNKIDNGKACTMKKCSSIDPVSDPKYNMHQIVKQSILLEEHLANKNKRCRDCITKHFSHIIGLAEEAVMLACSDVNKYPLMLECPDFYDKLFKNWLKDTSISLEVCKQLRIMRKKIIAVYFFDEKYALEKTDDRGV